MLENRWIPREVRERISPKQAQFLAFEGREALYGGAAGGGKSFALLIGALQFVEEPGYHALILRRTYKQLAKADSVLSVSKEWLRGKAKWNGENYTWTFPSGATLEFGHIEHADAVFNYQGAAYLYVGYDELTQFAEPMYRYLFSRVRRRAGVVIPPRMRAASNPGGVGHEWVKRRLVTAPASADRVFIRAKLADNPNLDAEQYRKGLAELDPLTRRQLEDGDWDAVAGGRFAANWFRYYTRRGEYVVLRKDGQERAFPLNSVQRFATVDPAASAKKSADYTVASVWCVSPWGDLVWLDCVRVQLEIPDIVPMLQQRVCLVWRPAAVAIEAVAANRAVLQIAQRAQNPVVLARELSPLGEDKLVRATPGINLAASGRLWLPAESPTFPREDVEAELVRFTGDPEQDAYDDIVDTLSYAAAYIQGLPTGDQRHAKPMFHGGG